MEQKQLIEPMEFYKYDKISDDVIFLGGNAVLRFTTSLSKEKGGNRDYYYHEFEYPSKYRGGDTLVTIRRSFDYYLSLENVTKPQSGEDKAFIRIGLGQFLLFRKGLEEVISWFQDEKWDHLFVTKKGKLTITANIPMKRIGGLPSDKYVEFMPIIIDKGLSNNDKEPGVRMYLSSEDNYCDMTLDKIFGLYYIFSTFNMYQSALSMLDYIGRPPFGTERVTITTNSYVPNRRVLKIDLKEPDCNDGITGRKVIPRTVKQNISALE